MARIEEHRYRMARIEERGDGLYRLILPEPVYDPEGEYVGDRDVYWRQAYLTRSNAERAVQVMEIGGLIPRPYVEVSFDTGERI